MSYYSFRLLAVALLTVFFATAGGAQTAGPRPLITQAIDENKLVTLVGNTRPEAQPQNDAGPAADDFHLDMYLQLKRSAEQETAAREFVESLTDKTSPNFHKWITAAEYGQRFGAAAGDIATVSRWLESHGFTVNGVPANKMVIDFSGNAGQVRAALHTEIHKLNLEGKQYFANVSDPQIPAALVPAVTGVVSLSDFRPRSMYTPRAQYTANSEQHIVVPGDLAIIYNLAPAFAAGYTGAGQTIAVLEDTDLFNGTGDWNTFRQTFNLTQYANGSLTQVHPGPSAGITCQDPGVNYDDAEAALDVEWASAAAPDAAVVMASCESSSTNFGGFIALQNMLAGGGPLPSVVSISYGEPETDAGAALNSYINTLYQTAAAAGVSVFVSSGDAAAAGNDRGWLYAIHGLSVSSFASTPYNVAVGGTDFGDTASRTTSEYWQASNRADFSSAKSYIPEIPWNDSCGSTVLANYYGYASTYGPNGLCTIGYFLEVVGGSGGPSGCATGSPSAIEVVGGTCAGYPKPSWQSIFGNPSDGVRDLPDVSLFAADGFWGQYYVFCYSDEGYSCTGSLDTWAGGGGTSFSSPIMAGIQALINQAIGQTNVGNPNPVYYQIGQSGYISAAGAAACNAAAGPAASCSFNDVTKGEITVPCVGVFNCMSAGEAIGVLSTSNTAYQPAYAAAPGWDFATGIGTVNAFALLTAFMEAEPPASAPPAPRLASPVNGANHVAPGTPLTWSVATSATAYDVYLGSSPTPGLLASTMGPAYTPAGLAAGTTYYWAVGARNSVGGNISQPWSFTTSCVAALGAQSAMTPAGGGSGTIAVNALPGCAWTAVSNAVWITITSGASGSGNGTVGFTVALDRAGLRTGTITVAGQTFTVTQVTSPLISTLAGGGTSATPAAATSVSIPVGYGVAVDSAGNVYFPSPALNMVFKADASGVVTRVAGSGIQGFAGDGGPALEAQLNSPVGVAVDSSGNVYISDSANAAVRKMDLTGVITTYAGNGNLGSGGDGGPAASASLNAPYGLAVDASGNLFIADPDAEVIRKVSAAGVISTVAGNGAYGYSGDGGPAVSASLYDPIDVTVDASGNLYIADLMNYVVRKVDPSGIITTVAGNGTYGYKGDGGPATAAEMWEPYSVAVDAKGDLYVADYERIREVNSAGIISTVVGNGGLGFAGDGGPAASAELNHPYGLAVGASGNLYISDYSNLRIREVSAGIIQTIVGGGSGDGGLAVFGSLQQPMGVVRDNLGDTYISDMINNRVRKVAASGLITTVAGTGVAGFSGDGGAATAAQLHSPLALALDASGNLYIADSYNNRVRKVDGSGKITTIAGSGFCCKTTGSGGKATSAWLGEIDGMAVDGAGNLYLADQINQVIWEVTASGNISVLAGTGKSGFSGDGGPATQAEIDEPYGLALDASGDLYIADSYNERVRVVYPNGTIDTFAGNGQAGFSGDVGPATSAALYLPTGLTVDSAGNLYIADSGNSRVRVVSAAGDINTIAGDGISGDSGDGGSAVGASFGEVNGISVDASGAVAIADATYGVVRILTPALLQPVLSIQSAHTGNFIAGSSGAYTVTLSNAAMAGATSGTVTVTEELAGPLSLAGMAGSGWSCTGNTCAREDSLAGGASYPPITVTVNVTATTPDQATNLVGASGGGSAAAGGGDFTIVDLPALLTISKTHTGSFTQGQTGAYTVTVWSVSGAGAPNGAISVTDALPSGLTLASMAGTGWTCTANSCTRSDSPGASASYPPIIVTVNVAADASSPQVNAVTLLGGGSAAASATDSTNIVPPCSYALNFGGAAFPVAGGSGSVSVAAASGCAWTASSAVAWAAITAGAGGSGNGTVVYQVAANTGGARSGALTVGGIAFTVEQASATVAGLAPVGSMAQLASGGLWNTTITLLNTGAASAEVVLNFFDDNGNALPLPLLLPEESSGAPILASTLDRTIAAGAQLEIVTAGAGSQPDVEGWAQVLANGGPVGGSAVFAYATAAGRQEAVAPVETRNPNAFVLQFNYTGGYATGVALANLSNQAVSVPVELTDNTGASLGPAAPIQLAPWAHAAFMLDTSYPAVAGQLGAMEMDTPKGGQISAVGIRAAPGGAITSIPVLAK